MQLVKNKKPEQYVVLFTLTISLQLAFLVALGRVITFKNRNMKVQYSLFCMASSNGKIKGTLNHQFCTPNLNTFPVLRNRDSRAEGWHREKRPRARFDEKNHWKPTSHRMLGGIPPTHSNSPSKNAEFSLFSGLSSLPTLCILFLKTNKPRIF